jgi:hypothetical protein
MFNIKIDKTRAIWHAECCLCLYIRTSRKAFRVSIIYILSSYAHTNQLAYKFISLIKTLVLHFTLANFTYTDHFSHFTHPVILTTPHLIGPHKMPFQFIIYTDQFHTRCVLNIGTDCRYMYCSKSKTKFRNCTTLVSKPATNRPNTNTQWNQGVTLTPPFFFHLRKKTNVTTFALSTNSTKKKHLSLFFTFYTVMTMSMRMLPLWLKKKKNNKNNKDRRSKIVFRLS